jgi:hypothetical protein
MAWLTSLPTAIKISELTSQQYTDQIVSGVNMRRFTQTLAVVTEEYRGLDETYAMGTTHGLVSSNTFTDTGSGSPRTLTHEVVSVNKQRANNGGGYTITVTTTTDTKVYT